jgi:hypothetical protein
MMLAMIFGLRDIMRSSKRLEEPWSFWLLVTIELLCEFGIAWALWAMLGSVFS